MRKVIYSMGVSLDGFIAGPEGEIDFSAPDEELHRFHNEQTRELGLHLCGRRLYETMLPWETTDESSFERDYAREFARVWKALPKVVFSSTLTEVEGNATLMRDGLTELLAEARAGAGGDIAVGGAALAGAALAAGLVDEIRLFVNPVALGGGTPFFPPGSPRLELGLLESRRFGSRVVYSRYAAPTRAMV
jgi:dihydrofolate reductase